MAHNSDRYFEFIYSVAWMGAVFVPINTRLAPPEIQFWINDSESKVIFVDSNFSNIISNLIKENKIPSVEKVVYLSDDSAPENMIEYESLLEQETLDDAMKGYNDLSGIFYTGGTTGRSKGVMLSHTNMVINAFNGAVCGDFGPHSQMAARSSNVSYCRLCWAIWCYTGWWKPFFYTWLCS